MLCHSLKQTSCSLQASRRPRIIPFIRCTLLILCACCPSRLSLYGQAHPEATPAQVAAALVGSATRDAIRDKRMLPSTPNRLLYTGEVTE